MRKTKLFFAVAAAFFLPFFLQAQDIHFSQFYMAPLIQNPAMTGAVWDMEAIVNYKDQWQSIGTPYKTMAASFDMKLNRKKAKRGLWAGGVNFFNDKAGDAKMSSTQANLNFAYHVFLSKYSNLGAGFQLGFAQRSISYSDLSWGNQFNGNNFDVTLPSGEPVGRNSFTYMDMGAGVVWHYN
ncbi:MAG TPA: PorP/SprF family type IX secretion system membrane protein, partial [Bacteroidia bacterium]|nr:PorP/SprF family type IX secretion system membrane protein [Bacteroidia bacterium]